VETHRQERVVKKDRMRPRFLWFVIGMGVLSPHTWVLAVPGDLLQTFSNPSPGYRDGFGESIAPLGDRVLIGAPLDDTRGSDAGMAYLFSASTGDVMASFPAPGLPIGQYVGTSVAWVGDDVLMGSYADRRAYLLDGSSGALVRTFEDPVPGGRFGWCVAEINGKVVVGDEIERAAYVFDVASGSLQHTLQLPSSATVSSSGKWISGFRDDILVAATTSPPGEDDSATAYLFSSVSGGLLRTFAAPATGQDVSVGAGADRVVIGTPNSNSREGSAYVFAGATGELMHALSNPDPVRARYFGWDVEVVGEHVVIGAPALDINHKGRAHVYSGETGELLLTIDAPTSMPGSTFGSRLAAAGDDVLIGAPGAGSAGMAYLFEGFAPPEPPEPPPPGTGYDLPIAEKHRLSDGWQYIAQQGIAAGEDNWFTCMGSTLIAGVTLPIPAVSSFDSGWNRQKLETVEAFELGGVQYTPEHLGDIAYSAVGYRDGEEIGPVIYAPVDAVSAAGAQKGAIAMYRASDLARLAVSDLGIGNLAVFGDYLYGVSCTESGDGILSRITLENIGDASKTGEMLQGSLETRALQGAKFANGVAFCPLYDYFYVSCGDLRNPAVDGRDDPGWDHGEIRVYSFDEFDRTQEGGTIGVVQTLTYPIPPLSLSLSDLAGWYFYHAEGLTFDGTDMWVAEWNHVARLDTTYLPKYKSTWTGSEWTPEAPNPQRTAHVESGSLSISGNLQALGLIVEPGASVLVGPGSSLTCQDVLGIEGGSLTNSGGLVQVRRLEVGVRELGSSLLLTGSTAQTTVSGSATWGRYGSLSAVPGASIRMTGSDLLNESTNPTDYADLINLTMVFEGGEGVVDSFEVAGINMGATVSGEMLNFAIGSLILGGENGVGQVTLVDEFDNQPGWEGREALYLRSLIVNPGSVLYIDQADVYVNGVLVRPGDGYLYGGGAITIPEPATLSLLALGGLALLRRRRGRNAQ
jgi:hypothetical protein